MIRPNQVTALHEPIGQYFERGAMPIDEVLAALGVPQVLEITVSQQN